MMLAWVEFTLDEKLTLVFLAVEAACFKEDLGFSWGRVLPLEWWICGGFLD